MIKKRLSGKKGFTLIELVIVLAIAALILAAVLLAVSGAQRARRDTQRKSDLGTIGSYLEQYASNNQGSYPASVANATTFTTQFLATSSLKDPSANVTYVLVYQPAAPPVGNNPTTSTNGDVWYMQSANCAGAGGSIAAIAPAQNRVYAIEIGLDTGGHFCLTNQ